MLLIELKDTEAHVLGIWMAQEHSFRTGSRGYLAQGKVEIDGRRYQLQAQLVEIGSKPNGNAKTASEANPTAEPTG